MKLEKVLVRRQPDGSFVEVGVVTSSQGTALTLVLDDGTEVLHERAKGELTPDRWSLAHLQRVAPAAVRDAVAESPHTVFKQILSESRKPMRAAELKARLEDVDPSLLDKAWKRAKVSLDQDPAVESTSGGAPRYSYHAPDDHSFRAFFPDARTRPGLDPLVSETPSPPQRPPAHSREDESPGPNVASVSDVEQAAPPSESVCVPQSTSTSVKPVSPVKTEAEPERGGANLSRRLVELGARGDIPEDLTRRPLTLSMLVDSLSASSRKALVEVLAEPDRVLVGHTGGEFGVRSTPIPGLLTHSVQDALAEVKLSPSDQRQRMAPHLLRLLKKASGGGDLTVAQAVAAAGAFAHDPVHAAGLNWALDELAARIQRDGRAALGKVSFTDLARAARGVHLERESSRSRLLLSIFRLDASEAAQRRWWMGVETTALAEVGRGPLGTFLEHPSVSEQVVMPAVRAYLDAVPTRQTVGAVLSWPRLLSQHVDGDELVRMMGAVARGDDQMAGWLAAIADLDRVQGLEQELVNVSEEVARLRDQHHQMSAEAARLRDLLDRSTQQLAATRQTSAASSDAHDRQARIDGIRSVALLAAQVYQSSSATQDTALIRQVDHLCAREGLDATEPPGARTIYDPAAHESLTPRLEPNSPADVVRGGYTWTDGDQPVVILKAQVVAAQE